MSVSGTALDEHRTAPEWIELLPAGEFTGRDGRGPFRLSSPAEVIRATDALRMEAGLPIDYDHATDFAAPAGRPAPAAGWIRAIEVRDGSLWGRVEWTRHGAAAVATHEYRYVSPVFEYSKSGEVTRLLRAALTNNPNLYLTAISARAAQNEAARTARSEQSRAEAGPGRGYEEDLAMNNIEAQLRELLGLDEEAAPDEIVAEVRRLSGEISTGRADGNGATAGAGMHRAGDGGDDPDPARFVPIAQYESALTELNRVRAASARERAGYRVEAAMKTGKIVPAQREWAIAYCQADPHGFENFVARQPAVIAGVTAGFEGEPAAGSGAEGLERGRARVALTRTELAICARLGLRPQDYARRRSSRDDFPAFNQE
jgi:phage I-like protein